MILALVQVIKGCVAAVVKHVLARDTRSRTLSFSHALLNCSPIGKSGDELISPMLKCSQKTSWVYKLSGQKAAAFDEKIGTVLSTKPIWRNVRRNGFKTEVFAISLFFSAHQFNHVFSRRICHDRRIIVFTVCSRKKIAYRFLPFTVSGNDLSVWERGTLTSSKVSPLFERYTLRKRRAASSGQFLYPRKFFLHPSIFVTFETMPMIFLVSEAMDFVRAAYSL